MLDERTLDVLFCNQDVRELLSCVIDHCQSNFDKDPHKNSYNLGRRSIADWLVMEMKRVNFDAYLKMMREKNDRERTSTNS